MNIWIRLFLISFLLFDLGYSFIQHCNEPLDGDLSAIVLPSDYYSTVLENPFGYVAISEGKRYGATNRYFIHAGMSNYFKTLPFFFQNFTNPIESIYLSVGLFKILIQILILIMLVSYGYKSINLADPNVLLLLAIATPLFQATIYNAYFGIISVSITYTWFYALPIALLLLFFLPFYKSFWEPSNTVKSFSPQLRLVLFILIIVLSFSGPLIPGIVLIICPGILFLSGYANFKNPQKGSFTDKILTAVRFIPNDLLFFFSMFSILCCYSFYLGQFNVENVNDVLLFDRYKLLPYGIFLLLTTKLAYPILLTLIIVNSILLYKVKHLSIENRLLWKSGKYILFFSLIYILLLPLGGYREYRPYIVRADTLSPIIILLFLFYVKSTFLIYRSFRDTNKIVYISYIILFSIILSISDEPNTGKNKCEKEAIVKIAKSRDNIVKLNNDCSVMEYDIITDPQKSKSNGKILNMWGITSDVKMYFQTSD